MPISEGETLSRNRSDNSSEYSIFNSSIKNLNFKFQIFGYRKNIQN